jgi:flagellar biosynthetic protein FliP
MTVGAFIHRGGHSHAVHFLRHLLEMTAAMVVGMIAGGAIFVTALGATVDQAIREHPISFVLVMAASMTAPMVAWMRFRGHEWRSCTEMGSAMVIPAIALICLRMTDVIGAPICGFYCALTIVAMIGLMLYRRSDYGGVSAIAPR